MLVLMMVNLTKMMTTAGMYMHVKNDGGAYYDDDGDKGGRRNNPTYYPCMDS